MSTNNELINENIREAEQVFYIKEREANKERNRKLQAF